MMIIPIAVVFNVWKRQQFQNITGIVATNAVIWRLATNFIIRRFSFLYTALCDLVTMSQQFQQSVRHIWGSWSDIVRMMTIPIAVVLNERKTQQFQNTTGIVATNVVILRLATNFIIWRFSFLHTALCDLDTMSQQFQQLARGFWVWYSDIVRMMIITIAVVFNLCKRQQFQNTTGIVATNVVILRLATNFIIWRFSFLYTALCDLLTMSQQTHQLAGGI